MSRDIADIFDETARSIYKKLLEDLRKRAVESKSLEDFCGHIKSSVSISRDSLDDEVLNMLKRGEKLLDVRASIELSDTKATCTLDAYVKDNTNSLESEEIPKKLVLADFQK